MSFELDFWIIGGALCVVLLLGLGILILGIGCLFLYDARQLRLIQLVINHRGIGREDQPQVMVPWDRIRHVVVSTGNPGWRRLLVDDGRMPEDWWTPPTIYAGRAQLRLLARRRRLLVNVPIDRLDVPADQIIRAIRHHSGGRFPDLGRRDLG